MAKGPRSFGIKRQTKRVRSVISSFFGVVKISSLRHPELVSGSRLPSLLLKGRNPFAKTFNSPARRRSLYVGTVIVVTLLVALQTLLPQNNQNQVSAAANSVTWTSQSDFENNTVTTGTATTRSLIDTASTSDAAKLSATPLPAKQTQGDNSINSVATGDLHSLALLADGTIRAWGSDSSGQLGNDVALTYQTTPVTVTGISNAVAIAAGASHSLALLADGTIRAWGHDGMGQLGDDAALANKPTPVTVTGISNAVAIAAGGWYSMALLADGTIRAWGSDNAGQLGNDVALTDQPTPVTVTGISNAVAIAAGGWHSMALLADGTIRSWGYDTQGQLGNDAPFTNQPTPVTVTGISNAVAIAAGSSYSMALLADGTIRSWGDDAYGQLGDDAALANKPTPVTVTGISNAVAIAAGQYHSLALLADGTIRAWGRDYYGQLGNDASLTDQPTPVTVTGISGAVAIDAGGSHSMALLADGTIRSWGRDNYGQLGNDVALTDQATPVTVLGISTARTIKSSGKQTIAAGSFHSMAIGADGTIISWGGDGNGMLGNDAALVNQPTPVKVSGISNAVAVAAGSSHSLALLSDGTIRSWGWNNVGQLGINSLVEKPTPVTVSGISNAVAIAAGNSHSMALLADGTIRTWGSDTNGQLGDDVTLASKYIPVTVAGISNAVAIAGGGTHSMALLADGTIRTWGSDGSGQLGDDVALTQQSTPVIVSGISNAVAIDAGYSFSVSLLADGTIRSWGYDGLGQLGNDASLSDQPTPVTVSGISNAVAINSGNNHSHAIIAGGTIRTWGYDGSGQLGNDVSLTQQPTPVTVSGISNAVAIVGGSSHSIALLSNGMLRTWGADSTGQLGNDASLTQQPTPVVVAMPSSYSLSGTISGVNLDAGASQKVGWSQISWLSVALPANTSITIQARTSDDNITWSDPTWGGIGSSSATQSTLSSTSGNGSLAALTGSRYLELRVTLATSDGLATPTLNDFTVSYNSLESPTLPKSFKTNGTEITLANTNNFTNDTSVNLKSSVPLMAGIPTTGETLTPEVELVTGGTPTFTTNKTTFPSGGVSFTPATHSYTGAASDVAFGTFSGLTTGTTYNWKIRYTDQAGRVGPWSSTYATFTPEQTAPTVTGFTAKASDDNVSYVNAGTRILKFSGTFDDAGGSSGTLKVQYSQDGTNWGVINGTNDGNLTTTDWTNFTTITASATSQNIINGTGGAKTWYLTGSEGAGKQLYVRTMDMAGNVSGNWLQTSDVDFTPGTTSEVVVSGNSLSLSAVVLPLNTVDNGNGTWTSTFYSSSGDGYIRSDSTNSWTMARDVATEYTYVYPTGDVSVQAFGGSDDSFTTWTVSRVFLPFDTSVIPDGATIQSATLGITGLYNTATNANNGISVVSSSQASTNGLTSADFSRVGSVVYATRLGSSLSYGTFRDELFALNASGLANINKTSFSKFALRENYNDIGNITPSTPYYGMDGFNGSLYSSENAGTSGDPKLVVTYTAPGEYKTSGDFTSAVKDNLTFQNYGSINWSANIPSQTGANAVRFQVASNNDNSTWNYIGPDGTAGTYYTTSGTQLHSSHNGNRYIRYKAYLQTSDSAYTPTVYDVSIGVNTSNKASNTLTLDTSAPTGTVSIDSGAQYAASASVTLTNNAVDTGGSALSQMQFSNDGTTWSGWETYAASKAWSLSAGDGAKTVYAKYRDNAGNEGGVINPNSNWTAGQAEAGYPTALVGKYVYNVDAAGTPKWKNADTSCVGPQCSTTVAPAPDVNYPSNMVLVDPIANPGVVFGATYPAQEACKVLGGRLPTVNELRAIYAGKVAGRYGSFTTNFYWSAIEKDSINAYLVDMNSGTLGAINKTVAIWSTRCVTSPTPNISASVILDTAGPTITDNQAGDDTWRAANAATYNMDFTDSGSGLANYQIKVTTALAQGGTVLQDWYSVDLSAQASPYTTDWSLPAPVWTALQEGTNYISIKAVDKAGQSTTLNDPFYIKKDTQAPTTSVSYASGIQASTSVALSLVDSDTQSGINTRTLEYQEVPLVGGVVDFSGAIWNLGTAVTPFTGTTGKAYKFRYSTSDMANNNSTVSSPSNWLGVDTTTPSATISYASGVQNTTSIALTKTEQDTQSGLNDYDIEYKIADYQNNSADFSLATWQEVGGDAGDQALSSYTGQSGKAYKFRYRVRNGAYTWGAGSTEGTAGAYFEPSNWVAIDTAAPTGTIVVNEAHNVATNYYVNTTTLSFSLTAAETGGSNLATYELSDTDGPWGVSSQVISGTSSTVSTETWTIPDVEGSYTKYVRYTDLAGNSTTYSVTVIYDKTAPVAPVLTSPANNLWQLSNAQTFGFVQSLSADIDHYELVTGANTVAVANISEVSNTVAYTLTAQGMTAWRIVAVDRALNRTDSTEIWNIGWDQNIPSTTLDPGFTFAATDTITDKVTLSWNTYADDSSTGSPAASYTIEKVKTAFITTGQELTQNWSLLAPEAQYDTMTVPASTHSLDQVVKDEFGVGDIDGAAAYTFRIRVTDMANNTGNWMKSDPGMSYDSKAPTNPSVVTATANGGFETALSWTASADTGKGVTGYKIYRKDTTDSNTGSDFTLVGYLDVVVPGASVSTVFTDNDTSNQTLYSDTVLGVSTTIKSVISPKLNDYTTYYYRVTAVDANGNESPVISQSSDLIPMNTSENEASVQTPDVTAPLAATDVYANAVGLDNVSDDDPKQEIDLSWTRALDLRASGRTPEGNGVGLLKYNLYMATENSTVLNVDPGSLTYTSIVNDLSASTVSYKNVRLEDNTYYYYKLVSYDQNGLQSSDSQIFYALTGSSKLPSAATQVDVRAVKGDTATNDRIGKDMNISFVGAKYLDPGNTVTGYEVYRSTVNYPTNAEWISSASKVKTYTSLNIPNNTLDPGENGCELVTVNNGGTDIDVHKRCFTDNTLPSDATTYYYKVRTVGYSTTRAQVVYSSGLSGVISGTVNAGWDTAPDATAPVATEEGMAIRVKDTYPKALEVRNILTWLVPTVPTRNGVDDFGKYEIWRELRSPTSVVTESKVAEITDIATNMYIDEASTIFDEYQFKYYILVFDNAGTEYKYANGSPVNAGFSNKTAKIYSGDSIVPKNSHAIITDVALQSVNVSSATVTWTTDQDTDSLVEYRPMKSVNGSWQVDSSNEFVAVGHRERAAQHSVYIFSMKPNTKYEYRVVSKNYPFANETVASSGLPELVTAGFNISPASVISTTSTTEINWTTNLDASSAFVEYQLQRQPGDDAQGGTAGVEPLSLASSPRSHKVVVKGLRSSRTYTYKIKSISKDGYLSEYPGGEFATFKTKAFDSAQFTLAPASSNVAERNITATTAQIVWQTESPTTSWVDYSTTSGVYDGAAGNNDLVGTHVVVIEGLIPGTKYYYRVRVKDANEVEYTSQEYSFTAVLKPKISNMTVKDVTPYSVAIAWDTNVDTETIINWGKTAAYGEKRGKSGVSKVHEIVVDKLDDNQEYHYQILAKDDAGNEVADTDKIVRTPLDTEGPKITNVKIDVLPMGESDTTSSIIVSWQTNKPATTLVEYGEGVIGGTYDKRSVEDTTLNNSHTVIIKGLTPASSYHYRLVSSDKRSNKTITQDYTFVTPSKEKSILQLILRSLEETFAWTKNLNQFFGNIGNRLTGR